MDDGISAYLDGHYMDAYEILSPVAQAGDPLAEFYLGKMHELGKGISRDYEEAVRWYTLSAEKGNVDALCALGGMHEFGMGVSVNYRSAARFYAQAADNGHAEAADNLAFLIKRGLAQPPPSIGKAPSVPGTEQVAVQPQRRTEEKRFEPNKILSQERDKGKATNEKGLGPSGTFLTQMLSFRKSASVDFIKTMQQIDGQVQLSFLTNNPVAHQVPQCWSYFFSGCFVLLGAPTETQSMAAFYNPFLDGVLLTRWARGPQGGLRLDAAGFAGGCSFAAHVTRSGKEPSGWLAESTNKPLSEVLGGRTADFLSAFESVFSKSPNEAQNEFFIPGNQSSQLAAGMVSVAATLHLQTTLRVRSPSRPEFSKVLLDFTEALHSNDPERLPALLNDTSADSTLKRLASVPQEIRRSFCPYMAVPAGDTMLVLFMRPEAPGVVLAAYFDKTLPKSLLTACLFDLGAAPKSATDPTSSPPTPGNL